MLVTRYNFFSCFKQAPYNLKLLPSKCETITFFRKKYHTMTNVAKDRLYLTTTLAGPCVCCV